ncbi:MAG: DUF6186 family protein [Sporichthyaceae bacterium]|nr:DUF6186 family protein [Sporichthyaceae bacterium]
MTSHNLTVAGFATILLAFVLVDALARRPGSRIPTLSDLLAFVMRTWPGRVGVLFFWWWFGWHFIAR